MNKDLFLSILAMDSYNRGYDAGLEGLGGEGEQIGWATIKRDAEQLLGQGEAQAADFYVIAYDIGSDGPESLAGKTVISYRGTNSAIDHSTGWIVGAGNIDDWTQAPLALDFYNAVTGTSYRDGPAGNVILTGHSLGGGQHDLGPAPFGTKMARAA